MPRYYYNVSGETNFFDDEGVNFRDVAQACSEALRYAAGIISDDARKNTFNNRWRLEVTDTNGIVLFCLDLVTTVPLAKGDHEAIAKVASVSPI